MKRVPSRVCASVVGVVALGALVSSAAATNPFSVEAPVKVSVDATGTDLAASAQVIATDYSGSRVLISTRDSTQTPATNLYVVDTTDGEARLITRPDGGGVAGGGVQPTLSANLMSSDGDAVAFEHSDAMLDTSRPGRGASVYVYHWPTNDLELASVASDGTPAGGGVQLIQLSHDGRYVLFNAVDVDLTTDEPIGATSYLAPYLRDLETGITTLLRVPGIADVNYSGTQWQSQVMPVAMSNDADVILYQHRVSQGMTRGLPQGGLVWMWRRSTSQIWEVVLPNSGDGLDMTPDGRWLAISTNESLDPTTGDQPQTQDGYSIDLAAIQAGTPTTPRIFTLDETNDPTTICGQGSNRYCHEGVLPVMSDDGNRVSFTARYALDRSVEPINAPDGNRPFVRDLSIGVVRNVLTPPFATAAPGVDFSNVTGVLSGNGKVVFIHPDSQAWKRVLAPADSEPPTVTATISPAPNGAGWNNGDTTVSFNCSDALSGVASCSGPVTLTGETAGQEVTGTATDNAGNTASSSVIVRIDRTPPLIAPEISPSANDAGWNNDDVTVTFSCSDGLSGNASCSAPVTITDEGAGQVVLGTATDVAGNSASASVTVSVDTTPPAVGEPVFSINPKSVGEVTDVTATASDGLSGLEGGELFIGEEPGQGQATPMNLSGSTLSATIGTSLPAGVYTVCVRSQDRAFNWSVASCALLVVYDPDGGFVTGGGWINSPPGAFAADASLSGRAEFGFVSKYKKGATTPSGSTEFQFKVARLNFRSENYEWLVVSGARAQYKGTGTINGVGNYGFLLTAIDGQVDGGGGIDRFRIKIWDKDNGDALVYDNELGVSDGSDPTTALGGGSIVIHKS